MCVFIFVCSCLGPAPGWYVEYVDVRDDVLDKTFRFPCNRWLAKNEDDGQLIRELGCANNDILDLNEKTSECRSLTLKFKNSFCKNINGQLYVKLF